jgi:hypothetical protein
MELIKENNSMMLKRNLLAPLPPGSQFTNCASIARAIGPNTPVAVVTLLERTPKEEYALRRQSRTVAYRKQREDFFKGKTTKEAVDKVEISLNDILELMVTLSKPEKKRYTYASASPTKDMRCSVCEKQFNQKNKKYVSLLHC